MRVNVIRIEELQGKFPKKVLHIDDGSKINVNKSNKSYDYVMNPGQYDIEFGEYQGHKFPKTIKAVDWQKDTGSGAKTSVKGDFDKRIAFDKERQKEIKLECYAGISKDILLHNAALAKRELSHVEVMAMAKNMVMLHDDIIVNDQIKQLPENVDEMVKEVAKTFDGAYEGELPA